MANKKIRKMVVLAKVETVRGTDAVPTGAANAMQVSNVNITALDGAEVSHNYIKPYFGNQGSVMVTASSKLTFEVEMSGSGAAGTAPGYAVLLRACACSVTLAAGVSVTVAPISDALESMTLYANVDGINHVMRDAHGLVKAKVDAKGLPVWQFDFTGLFTPLADAVLPAATYTAFLDSVAVNKANSNLSLHGKTLAASAFTFDTGNTVVKRDLMSVDSVELTDRKSTASVTFENTSIATKDWVGAALASSRGVMTLVHGVTAGNIVTINAPLAQAKKPSYSDSDGVQMITVPLELCTGAAGNDEWSIVLT